MQTKIIKGQRKRLRFSVFLGFLLHRILWRQKNKEQKILAISKLSLPYTIITGCQKCYLGIFMWHHNICG